MSRQILQIAWRSLWRTPRRTLIVVAAIALGYTTLLVFACLMEGFRQQLIENGTGLGLSHIQVHAPGYYPDRSIYHTLGGREGVDVRRLFAAVTSDPQVRAVAPRVYGYGLVSSADLSAGAGLLGVVPGQEQQVSTLHNRIVAGSYLTEQIPKGIIVGDKLADAIKAHVGSDVVLLAQATDGTMGNDLYTVVGVFHTGLETMDRGLVLLPLPALQDLLALTPERIHEIGIILSDATEATAMTATLASRLEPLLPVHVRAWPELAPDLADYVQLHRHMTAVLFFIVCVLAVIGIMNTMLMSVFERTREFGMLMAVGIRPVHIVSLIVAEAGGLVGIGLLVGGGVGMPLLWYLQVYGLDLSRFMGEITVVDAVVDPLWHGRPDVVAYSQAALELAVTALVSALYPALRATRFQPVEAMQKA